MSWPPVHCVDSLSVSLSTVTIFRYLKIQYIFLCHPTEFVLDIVLYILSVSPCSVTGHACSNWDSLTCSAVLCVSVSVFGRMYSFMGGGLFCAGIGNILLIVSTATDYWMQYRHSSNYMHQGLWRYCVPGKCMAHTDSIGKTRCMCRGTSSFIFISLLTTSLSTLNSTLTLIHVETTFF